MNLEVDGVLDSSKENIAIQPIDNVSTYHDEIKNPNDEQANTSIFDENCSLQNHTNQGNSKETLQKCSICKKTFTLKDSLKKHIKLVHEEKKPYSCQICDKKFPRIKELRKHINAVHLGKKPNKCSTCEKMFYAKGDLKSHIKRVHEKQKPYSCYCSS